LKGEENVSYVMGCWSDDGENATIYISKDYEQPLISALQNFKNKVPLTKEDEMVLLALWHELTHLRTKDVFKFFVQFSVPERLLLETITEFIARHTYDEFFEILRPNTKPNYQKELIEEALGYNRSVRRFRYVLQRFKINEKEAVKELESILFEDCQNIRKRLIDWLRTKADLSEIESDIIIYDVVNLRISDEEFQKEVREYYKISKRQKNAGFPADIETIYDHGLTEEERLQWFGGGSFYPKSKEEYLQRLKRYEDPKSILNSIWHDLFILYFMRGDWAKAKEYLTKIDDKKARWLIVFMAAGGDVLTDPEWTKKARDYFSDVCEVWENF
jgi:tetratricopeptide (TPR) repeat protein